MGPVAAAVLLSMLLEPASLLIQEPPGTELTPRLVQEERKQAEATQHRMPVTVAHGLPATRTEPIADFHVLGLRSALRQTRPHGAGPRTPGRKERWGEGDTSEDGRGPAATDPTPHLNVEFDPWTMTLRWDCGADTTGVGCHIIPKDPVSSSLMELHRYPCSCSFGHYVLHAGILFIVTNIVGQRETTESLFYRSTGQEGTAAQSFSCFIYNVNFMNCSWTKGPAAPDDVQYFLYVQDSEKRWGRECPHYVRESGTHVGCHMPDVSSWASEAYFLVNGTSGHAKIQFFDSFLWLRTIERCNPPGNISVLCNATHCGILWEKPRTRHRLSDRDFQYQLQVQQEDDVERARSQLIELPGDLGNKYHLLSPQPRAAHTLRIRAADTRVLQWSAWSQPVTFGSQESGGRFVYVYVLVVLGTVVCVLAISCLIQRLCRGRRLFPPIPQIKDKLSDSRQPDQVPWETLAPAAGKEDVEDLLTMEEVAEPTAGTSDAATSVSP